MNTQHVFRVTAFKALLASGVLALMHALSGCGDGSSPVVGSAPGSGFGTSAPAPGSYCTRASVPPPPPDKGAVLWSPPDANPAHPNVIVLAFSNDFENKLVLRPISACTQVLKNLQTITVAPGGALMAFCHNVLPNGDDRTIVPWGAVNVTASDPRPLDFTKCWDIDPGASYQSMELEVTSPLAITGFSNSCRQCDFSGLDVQLGFPAYTSLLPNDFSGANFRNARLSGLWNGLNLSGADLSGAAFIAAPAPGGKPDEQPTLQNTIFDHAILQGTDFKSALIGGGAGTSCTSFKNTNLLSALFDINNWSLGCGGTLFSGTQVSLGVVSQLIKRFPLAQVNLTDAQIVALPQNWRSLVELNLSGINLSGVSFLGVPTDFTGVSFNGATLVKTNFGRAILRGSSFSNVNATGASFFEADLSGDGTSALPGANFSGPQTQLQEANFVNADISFAKFIGVDITGVVFSGARAVSTDFNSVTAANADFTGTHIIGNGEAFGGARDLHGAKFSGAVLSATGGGFNFTGAPLTGASFDGAVCVNCNFTNATLTQASFNRAYLPGVTLSQATLSGANFNETWFYCGDLDNSLCTPGPGTPPVTWDWLLTLGTGEPSATLVSFHTANLTNAFLSDVTACPDGQPGSAPPGNCQGHLLPSGSPPPIPAPCSASASGSCPSPTVTLFGASQTAMPLAIASIAYPTWHTLLPSNGHYVGFDDATVKRISDAANAPAKVIAGTAGQRCSDAQAPCGDGGPAQNALLGMPAGLAVDLEGSVYIADPALHRVRRIDTAGMITTIAGTGEACTSTAPGSCGDGGKATEGTFNGPYGIWSDPAGVLLIADGPRGIRRIDGTGILATISTGAHDMRAVTLLPTPQGGMIYATTAAPDSLVQINPNSGVVTYVVGTGTSGYNGNTNPNTGLLLPGTQVQVNRPHGIAVNRDGNVVFADTGNNLIRAYVPSTTFVIDDLAGVVGSDGTPKGGFSGDGKASDQTLLNAPQAVTTTANADLVIADTGNKRIRHTGPAPIQ